MKDCEKSELEGKKCRIYVHHLLDGVEDKIAWRKALRPLKAQWMILPKSNVIGLVKDCDVEWSYVNGQSQGNTLPSSNGTRVIKLAQGWKFERDEDYPLINERDYVYVNETLRTRLLTDKICFQPLFLINNNPDATNGPPVVTSYRDKNGKTNWIILSGNRRRMLLNYVGCYKKYYKFLISILRKQENVFGIDWREVEKLKSSKPILVRKIQVDGKDCIGEDEKKAAETLLRDFNNGPVFEIDPIREVFLAASRIQRAVDFLCEKYFPAIKIQEDEKVSFQSKTVSSALEADKSELGLFEEEETLSSSKPSKPDRDKKKPTLREILGRCKNNELIERLCVDGVIREGDKTKLISEKEGNKKFTEAGRKYISGILCVHLIKNFSLPFDIERKLEICKQIIDFKEGKYVQMLLSVWEILLEIKQKSHDCFEQIIMGLELFFHMPESIRCYWQDFVEGKDLGTPQSDTNKSPDNVSQEMDSNEDGVEGLSKVYKNYVNQEKFKEGKEEIVKYLAEIAFCWKSLNEGEIRIWLEEINNIVPCSVEKLFSKIQEFTKNKEEFMSLAEFEKHKDEFKVVLMEMLKVEGNYTKLNENYFFSHLSKKRKYENQKRLWLSTVDHNRSKFYENTLMKELDEDLDKYMKKIYNEKNGQIGILGIKKALFQKHKIDINEYRARCFIEKAKEK